MRVKESLSATAVAALPLGSPACETLLDTHLHSLKVGKNTETRDTKL